ncbi:MULTISPECIES: hypothetical protein [unclassified Pseudodesulfovibrio]|uniref:hypothetical protein n=1 Tax=unclassified Pseudodesulfovibrio TaxID=2661612 RepID=UPI000FEB9DDA|nr:MULTISPECIES: hypothetical protein [unclassified Pseudodesulfovibrio]MCJ2165335.1 hypothetical protein [Pseudodesulfovibrio sp. S3-i]RWU02800.1 hypothetical protein DWB63_14175 [Pseudodesulfovibrio sp. S3]
MIRLFAFVLALLCCVPPVLADTGFQLGAEPDFLLASPTNVSSDLQLQADFGYISDADFTNGLGSVSVSRSSLSADYAIFHLSYELSHFFWGSKADVARNFNTDRSVAPWHNLHDITLQARLLNNKFADKWRYWLNGAVNSSFEESLPGAVGVGFDGGVAYDFWNGWMLGITARTLAVSALSQDLFGEVEFGLAVAVSQKTLREAMKSIGLFENAKEGSDKIGLNFAISRAEKTYRLAADNPVYGNGYLGLVRSKVGVYVDYLPSDNLTLSIGPEYHYGREYRLYNKAGSYKSSYKLDNALGGYARILWKF